MPSLLSLLGVCLIAITVCYIVQCSISPWGECSHCHGDDRACWRCNGTGMRPRLIWQAAAYLLRTYGTRR